MSDGKNAGGKKGGTRERVRDIFGSLVFDKRAMKEHLPKNVFANLE
jgi:glutamine synthetase type III